MQNHLQKTYFSLSLAFLAGAIMVFGSVSSITNVRAQSTTPEATMAATNDNGGLAPDEQEITFKVGEDTFYGTLLIPAGAKAGEKLPAMLLISGSGPTDRDGNTRLLPGKVDSHKHFARVLADAGVASLRFDKFATGKTGLGSWANKIQDYTFDVQVDGARAAYEFLAARPEIDPARLGILGHSEGGLTALVLANTIKSNPPAALVLAAPLSKPYLTTVREQIEQQYIAAVKGGALTQKQADEGMAELDALIAQVLKDGTLPATISPQYKALFNPGVVKFLYSVGKYDPADLAAALPATLPALVMCGQKDIQVPCADVKALMAGFEKAGNKNAVLHELASVNHVFREMQGEASAATALVDYTDPNNPFSKEATQLLTEFVKGHLQQ